MDATRALRQQPVALYRRREPDREVVGEATIEVDERGPREFAPSGTHLVYWHLAHDGQVLYVGVTFRFKDRMRGHAQSSPWWPLVQRILVRFYSDRAAAEAAEGVAIGADRPKWNILREERNELYVNGVRQ